MKGRKDERTAGGRARQKGKGKKTKKKKEDKKLSEKSGFDKSGAHGEPYGKP